MKEIQSTEETSGHDNVSVHFQPKISKQKHVLSLAHSLYK